MSELAEVHLWGELVGAVAQTGPGAFARFEYNPRFLKSGLEVAPMAMPQSSKVYQFPALALDTFKGLPGLLADCLPDRWGNTLIDAWLATQGRAPGSFGPISDCVISEAAAWEPWSSDPSKARGSARARS